ncbi:MAG TPA: class I SAM-dependent methyltransferase [Longimicrobiaceae bacterium]|nr:class I SAM-dependent methyltransferase [Longimicrobiaceae bacterium]
MKQFLRDFVVPPGILHLVSRFQDAREAARYSGSGDDYDAARYWKSHYRSSGPERIFSSANQGLDDEENRRQYESARRIFWSMVADFGLGPDPRVLEIGFGTGFYTGIVHRMGFRDYLGVDITDATIAGILARLDGFRGELVRRDAGQERIERPGCDLAYMVDVSQHIVNDDKLAFCLRENVVPNLKPGGYFIVTDELSARSKLFYEKTRTLDFYRDCMAGCEIFHQPISFRDKYVFSFRRVGA